MQKLFRLTPILLIVMVLLIVISIFKIVASRPIKNNDSIQIATSFYPLYFFTNEIAQNNATIKNITPSGAEPHDYEPTSQEIAFIEKSNLIILNGSLEPWANNIKNNLQNKNVTIVTTGEGLINRTIEEEGKKIQDPHIWLSPQLAKKQVDKILEGLVQVDPKNQTTYKTNADNLKQKLETLDTEYKTGLSNCTQKDIITSHAAFGYLAQTYGLNQVAISGISPDEEPSTKQIAEVAEFAKKNNVRYIFFETLVSPKLSETIATEIGAKTLVLNPLEGLSNDEMQQGKNYITIMQDNLKNLRIALECK